MTRETLFAILATLIGGADCCWADDAPNWPRFRGPDGAGIGAAAGVASEWTEAHKLWTAELGGVGHGSPVVGGGQLYVTTGDPQTGKSSLIALDAASGKEAWRVQLPGGVRHLHRFNSYASTTPALDAEHVYVTWATPGSVWLAAFTHAGEQVWKQSVGPYVSGHGFGCSPVVVDNVVCLANDHREESAILGFNTATGKIIWRSPRPATKSSYATPCVVDFGDRKGLIVNSKVAGMAAIDAANGEPIWRLEGIFPDRCVSSPVLAGELVFGTAGSGGGGKRLSAVRWRSTEPVAEEAYSLTKNVPYVPTPLVVGELMFLWHDRGTVACLDAATGELHWRERIGGRYFASPIAVDGAVGSISTDGEVVFVAIDQSACRVLARNDLQQPSNATPAVANNRLYVRTESRVVCIAGVQTATSPRPVNAR